VLRVPSGFMRNRTQERIETMAQERSLGAIDLSLVEEGIEFGKKAMAEMIAKQDGGLNEVGTMSVLAEHRAAIKAEGPKA
jgi:hypothetical protein